MKPAFTRWDAALVAVLLAANAALLLRPAKPLGAVEILFEAGKQVVDLSSSRRVEVPGPLGVTVVELGPRGARIVSSPCPNHLCVRSGWVTVRHPLVACLPNRVAVRILSVDSCPSQAGAVDAVAR